MQRDDPLLDQQNHDADDNAAIESDSSKIDEEESPLIIE